MGDPRVRQSCGKCASVLDSGGYCGRCGEQCDQWLLEYDLELAEKNRRGTESLQRLVKDYEREWERAEKAEARVRELEAGKERAENLLREIRYGHGLDTDGQLEIEDLLPEYTPNESQSTESGSGPGPAAPRQRFESAIGLVGQEGSSPSLSDPNESQSNTVANHYAIATNESQEKYTVNHEALDELVRETERLGLYEELGSQEGDDEKACRHGDNPMNCCWCHYDGDDDESSK